MRLTAGLYTSCGSVILPWATLTSIQGPTITLAFSEVELDDYRTILGCDAGAVQLFRTRTGRLIALTQKPVNLSQLALDWLSPYSGQSEKRTYTGVYVVAEERQARDAMALSIVFFRANEVHSVGVASQGPIAVM